MLLFNLKPRHLARFQQLVLIVQQYLDLEQTGLIVRRFADSKYFAHPRRPGLTKAVTAHQLNIDAEQVRGRLAMGGRRPILPDHRQQLSSPILHSDTSQPRARGTL